MHATDAIDVRSGWDIHRRVADWPVRANNVFVVAAFDRVMQSMFRVSAIELLDDPVDLSGYGTAAWSHLRNAIMSGRITTRVQPITGGALDGKPPTDWTPATVDEAIATGVAMHRLARKAVRHFVYVDQSELELMCKVLDATDMLHEAKDYGPLEELGDIVLSNITRLARPSPDNDPIAHAEAIIRMFVPSGRFDFDNHDDRDRFTQATAEWLERQFETDPRQLLARGYFEKLADRSFGNYMSDRIFGKAWGIVVAQPKNDDGTPDLSKPDPHKKRRTAGLRGSAKPAATRR